MPFSRFQLFSTFNSWLYANCEYIQIRKKLLENNFFVRGKIFNSEFFTLAVVPREIALI